jgi:uncharacterized protein (DUF924 family)
MPHPPPSDVLTFWFAPDMEKKWFSSSPDFDREIENRFGALYDAAQAGRLGDWEDAPESALALCIVLDQFPRNMFRDTPRAFGSDAQAQEVSYRALQRGFDTDVEPRQRAFFYLPLMHSEDVRDQQFGVNLYRKLGNALSLDYAIQHHDIIEEFGRFPHRNKVLGRESTPAETEFLKTHKGF